MPYSKEWAPRFPIPTDELEAAIDEFFDAYVEAALWSTIDDSDEDGANLDDNYGPMHIDAETYRAMERDSRKFLMENWDDLDGRFSDGGYDFWMTRNGHGVGFWEVPDWPKAPGKRMTEKAQAFGEIHLTVMAGRIYQL